MQSGFSTHLLSIRGLKEADIRLFLDTATAFLNNPAFHHPSGFSDLKNFTIANAFFENSTRTRISFELAEKKLGAGLISFQASASSVAKGESLNDTAQNLLALGINGIVLRHPAAGAAAFLARKIKNCCIINAGDGTHEHPTQALLDLLTLEQTLGSVKNKNIAIVGDIMHSRVALSNIHALKIMGANVELCGPPTLIPAHMKHLDVKISLNIEQTLCRCDALMTLRMQRERQQHIQVPHVEEYHYAYGITKEKLEKWAPKIPVLHPGPINRGVELDADVADGNNSLILKQVNNGLAIRMAVLKILFERLKA